MPVTTALLSRLRSLDDLTELTREIGFRAAPADLGVEARERLGIGGLPGIRRAAVLARHGHFLVYGITARSVARDAVAAAAERLARRSSDRFLLFALDDAATTLALACPVPSAHGVHGRVMRLALGAPSRISAEIIGGLAPRPGERALALAARIAEFLGHEGLTTRFFRELRRLHERASACLAGAPCATLEERHALTLVHLTRVLFLYFIQTKGWLAGRSDFLPSLLDLALARGHSFHRAAFAPLCFGALAAPPAARRGVARALGAVPFLNSGLFETHALERRFPRAELPNHTWRDLFDGLFERFHFTVRESDDADAVDPEMLGRVFEGLMARDRRRDAGAFYTPRPLLRRLVHETLGAALDDADAERLRRVRILDPAVGSGAFLLEALAWLEARRAARVPHERPVARRRAIIRDCLFGVDVDPMAVRLAELRLWLALVADEVSPEAACPLPNLDQNLRQGDSLLAPLDLGAARAAEAAAHVRAVAETRAAYFAAAGPRKAALARDIRAHEHAIALACTDADLARATARLADADAGRDLFGRRAVRSAAREREIRQWREQRRELRRLRERIAHDDTVPFFAYDVHFGEIVADGGFDVVLGNPPWVRGERLSPRARTQLVRRYRSFRPASAGGGFAHLPDLSVAFVERSLQLVREDGVVGMVLPAKLLRAGYAAPLRQLLRHEAEVLLIEDRSHAPPDFGATVFPMLCILRRGRGSRAGSLRVALHVHGGGALAGTLPTDDLPLDPEASRSPWLVLPADVGSAVRMALRAGPPLASHFRPRLGVKTGANTVFLRDHAAAGDLPPRWTRPAIQGRDVAPFRAKAGAVVLAVLDRNGLPLRAAPEDVTAYLAPHRATLSRRADALRSPPWALFRTELLPAPWLVLWRDIAERLEAAPLDRTGTDAAIPLNTCYGVAVDDAMTAWWLSAWLNSAPLRTLACATAERGSGGAFRFSAATVGTLPLPPRADADAYRELARLGRGAADGDPRSLDDLDAFAADLLGLPSRTAADLSRLGATLCRDAGRRR